MHPNPSIGAVTQARIRILRCRRPTSHYTYCAPDQTHGNHSNTNKYIMNPTPTPTVPAEPTPVLAPPPAPLPPPAAWIGLDWGHKEHAFALHAAPGWSMTIILRLSAN